MSSHESRIVLPPIPPAQESRPVAAWREALLIDTYEPVEPDRYPAYLDRRVYQGSSGRVYPLPFHERIDPSPRARSWDAVHLENAYVRLVLLPELGGRLHIGVDKTTGLDFFYRNNVIKPALVGLAGPWISGGVELNWPQHHRPATYLPTQSWIEHEPDGSVTVWCSDHDPFDRMKGMHGFRLRPDSAVVELRARLFNRTDDVRTFMWWANVAVAANDDYQSFFPTDVHAVADHAKRATTSFPATDRPYYGVDYSALVDASHPDANRIDWYRNILVPTSYMAMATREDFFGGYDHGAGAGLVHWADHRLAPGKKQWTWGNEEFGRAWDRNLTDTDGPYVELMAGVFTDNQPDFSYLAPGETKTFSQYWYPVAGTGVIHQASLDAALHLDVTPDPAGGSTVTWSVAVTAPHPAVTLTITTPAGAEIFRRTTPAAPGTPLQGEVHADVDHPHEVTLSLTEGSRVLVRWTPPGPVAAQVPPEPAREPAPPAAIPSVEELYLTGLHLEQYRHATRSPEPYWAEGLRRDPQNSRIATVLAARRTRQADYGRAVELLETAIARLTRLNANPLDGEPTYRLGQALVHLGEDERAYEAFGKAAWSAAWRAPSLLASARILARAGRWAQAVADAREALRIDPDQLQARSVLVVGLRHLGAHAEAEDLLRAGLDIDPLDWWARDLAGEPITADAPTILDIALEYASLGEDAPATRLLERAAAEPRASGQVGVAPLALLHLADLARDDGPARDRALARAAQADPTHCRASRLADVDMLLRLRAAAPDQALPAALLGHWYFAHEREQDAVLQWQAAADLDPSDPVVQRNLAIAAFNVAGDPDAAFAHYGRARTLAPRDARLLYEVDQLAARTGRSTAQRLAALAAERELVLERDDLVIEYAEALTRSGRPTEAVELIAGREFQPWEGGEGRVLRAWENAQLASACAELAAGSPGAALGHVDAALWPPASLGEGRHLLAGIAHLLLVRGQALAALGRSDDAVEAWEAAAQQRGDFQDMAPTEFSELSACSILALHRLGRTQDAASLTARMRTWLDHVEDTPAVVDYFATSLPSLLLFREDPGVRRAITTDVMRAQLAVLAGDAAASTRWQDAVLARDPGATGPVHLLRQVVALTSPTVAAGGQEGERA